MFFFFNQNTIQQSHLMVLWWGLALSDGGCQWRCGGGGVKILSNLGLGLGFSVFGLICCIWSFGPIGFYALYCFIRACKALRCLGFGPLGLCCIVISGRFRPSGVWALSLRWANLGWFPFPFPLLDVPLSSFPNKFNFADKKKKTVTSVLLRKR